MRARLHRVLPHAVASLAVAAIASRCTLANAQPPDMALQGVGPATEISAPSGVDERRDPGSWSSPPAAGAPAALAETDDPKRQFRTRLVVGGAAAAVLVYGGTKWWRDGLSGDFNNRSEGWFGRDTAYGGADKLGHAFSNYVGVRALSWTFEGLGHGPEQARRLAFWTTLGTFTAVEVIDGLARNWSFSGEDAVMNTIGAGVGYLAEKYPEFDRRVDFRLRYRRSYDGGSRSGWNPLDDYGGQTYLLVLKADGFDSLRSHGLLRYFEFALGYGARGFVPVDGAPGERIRSAYFGISLNVARLLDDTVFRGSRGSRAQRVTHGVLEFVQLPGTAALAEHRF